jgi:hypothetical protein
MSQTVGLWRVLSCGALILGVFVAGAGAEAPEYRELLRRSVEQRRPNLPPDRLPGLNRDVQDVIGLEYTVLLHKEGKDIPVDETAHDFHQGDQIRVRISPLCDMYVYIFYERAGGQRLCLQPISKESPPLAKRHQAFELPADGSVYEFDAPVGEEKLLIVATTQPSEELAVLADMVCRKSDEKLTATEKTRREQLRSRSQKILRALREEKENSIQYRGPFSEQALFKVGEELQRRGVGQAILEEPPHDKQKGTFCAAASFDPDNQPELFVSITLRSVPKSTAKQ